VKSILAITALLLAAHAVRAEGFTVRIEETAIIEIAGARSARTTNPLIAEVSMAGPGRLTVKGRGAGTTQLSIVAANRTQTFLIIIAGGAVPPSTRPDPAAPVMPDEAPHSSGTTQTQSASDVVIRDDRRSFLRGGTIDGFAFLDPEMRGLRSATTKPLPDIAVTLDGDRSMRTDGKGAYTFLHVAPGVHQIAAQPPAAARAFFTTPSHAETKVPAHIDFGLVWAGARVEGRVISDSGDGIAGAVLAAASRSGQAMSGRSDSEGHFVFAVPPGTFRVGLAPESLPPGYSIEGQYEKSVTVESDQAQSVSFEVQALRSVSGKAAGASEVTIESLGRTMLADAEGNFVFRSMPPGTFLITARSGGRTLLGVVALPVEPGIVRGVILGAPPSIVGSSSPAIDPRIGGQVRVAPSSPSPPLGRDQGDARYVVQTGAFQDARNALELVARLRRNGEQPFTVAANLTLVCIGPFETRREALTAADRLRRAGFEGFVKRR
jgi:hypothetical protein